MFGLVSLCVLLACGAQGLICGTTSPLQHLNNNHPVTLQQNVDHQHQQINQRLLPRVKGELLATAETLRGKSSKLRKLLLPLVLGLQFKTLSLVPVLLLVTLLVGLKTTGAAVLAAILSGASLLRDMMGSDRRGGNGASSRVSYEVKQPGLSPVTPNFNADPFYPGMLYTPPPEYKIFSAASNGRAA